MDAGDAGGTVLSWKKEPKNFRTGEKYGCIADGYGSV